MSGKSNFRSRTLIVGGCTALFLLVALIASRALTDLRGQALASTGLEAKAKRGNPLHPTSTVTDSPSARELGRNIERGIESSDFAKARWGIFVVSLRDGRVLYARDADRPISPASNMKILTTAVALDLLGADYRWRTSVYSEAAPDKSGTVVGDLTLYGRGAPDLSSKTEKDNSKSSLDELADKLYERGVRTVRGDIVGDESYLRGDALGDGWLWNDVQWYFGAEVSALSVNDNEIAVTVSPSNKSGEPSTIELKPGTSYVHLKNDTNTAERGEHATIGITRGLSDNEVRVWGEFPIGARGVSARLSVHQPALWAATLFRESLKRRGIVVEGEARIVDAREGKEAARVDPERAVELSSITSKTLGEIVRVTNKESINLYAELILRTLGKERGSTAPDADAKKMRTRGDDAAGVAVIRSWLEEREIRTEGMALHDGSGLSRLDLVTPEATVRVLALMTNAASSTIFRDSLPIAGLDGTLKFRLPSMSSGRIRAKTGTLTYINSLSGYVVTDDNEPMAFSIICNDETAKGSSSKTIDGIAALLASYRESEQ